MQRQSFQVVQARNARRDFLDEVITQVERLQMGEAPNGVGDGLNAIAAEGEQMQAAGIQNTRKFKVRRMMTD